MNPSQHAIGQVVEEDHEKKRKAIQIQLDQEIAPIFVEESARKVCEEKPRQKYAWSMFILVSYILSSMFYTKNFVN